MADRNVSCSFYLTVLVHVSFAIVIPLLCSILCCTHFKLKYSMTSSLFSEILRVVHFTKSLFTFVTGDIGNYYYGQGHPMKPHRIRMTHNLLLNYGLYRKMEIYVSFAVSLSTIFLMYIVG